MSADGDDILAGVLRPARPALARCLRALAEYRAAREDRVQRRIRSLAEIESRIHQARARVFAAGTGVVTAEMTALEREWREASRADAGDEHLERLWARVAPARWLGEPRRVAGPAEAIVTLASDPEGVEAAERAARALRDALSPWGVPIGASIRWCVASEVTFAIRAEELFAAPIAALSAVADHAAIQAAHRVRRDLRERLRAPSVPTRNSSIARELGFLAFASALWERVGARLEDEALRVDPIAAALDVWRVGYVPSAVDASGIVLSACALDPCVAGEQSRDAEP